MSISSSSLRRRASARAPLDGVARVEDDARARGFEIADVSFGGVGLVGDTRGFQVGVRVRVLLTARLGTRLDVFAEVRHVGNGELGLAWSAFTPQTAERVLYLVDSATRYAPPVPLPIGIQAEPSRGP